MLTFNFSPFPTLETERLILRKLTNDDVNEVFAFRSDKEVMKYICRPLAKNLDDAYAHIKLINDGIDANTSINWGITLKTDNKVIGIIGYIRPKLEHYRCEIGYILNKEHHRKGIMHEALKAVTEYGFTGLKFHSIEAMIDPANDASRNILLKNNFVKEAYFREDFLYEGVFRDTEIYSLLQK